jgi:hypothetical protein
MHLAASSSEHVPVVEPAPALGEPPHAGASRIIAASARVLRAARRM